ncbi:hypothetical protein V1J52_19225 [Streptomyces sp. TRM 70351]|nr:hypothetical protein [Streptomyces sp. TRM 70351]MEE1930288.1 hypothetical protein [Streptomyces sp. TRM 70351]
MVVRLVVRPGRYGPVVRCCGASSRLREERHVPAAHPSGAAYGALR